MFLAAETCQGCARCHVQGGTVAELFESEDSVTSAGQPWRMMRCRSTEDVEYCRGACLGRRGFEGGCSALRQQKATRLVAASCFGIRTKAAVKERCAYVLRFELSTLHILSWASQLSVDLQRLSLLPICKNDAESPTGQETGVLFPNSSLVCSYHLTKRASWAVCFKTFSHAFTFGSRQFLIFQRCEERFLGAISSNGA